MTTPGLDVEPACPAEVLSEAKQPPTAQRAPDLVALRRPFESIEPSVWDRLAQASPWATPFSRWAFHRAWWDAYGSNAHDQTLVIVDHARAHDANAPVVAIAPLMHRHAHEPGDAETATKMRHTDGAPLTAVPEAAKAVFFGASYHADYATLLASAADLPGVAEAVVRELSEPSSDPDHPLPWDVIDLRRLRCGDPVADELAAAFGRREVSCGWTLNVEREDVCPVVRLPRGGTFDDYLATLGKKERHEVRRKIRRADAAGDVRLVDADDPMIELETFIELHQKRWGADGLFPDGHAGVASRTFFRRLFELSGRDGPVRLSLLTVGERKVAAGVSFDDGERIYFYNAGIDPAAGELSPGVVMSAMYIRRAIELGRSSLDFLRGDESYKYEWGAVDEPIQRILVRRTQAGQDR